MIGADVIWFILWLYARSFFSVHFLVVFFNVIHCERRTHGSPCNIYKKENSTKGKHIEARKRGKEEERKRGWEREREREIWENGFSFSQPNHSVVCPFSTRFRLSSDIRKKYSEYKIYGMRVNRRRFHHFMYTKAHLHTHTLTVNNVLVWYIEMLVFISVRVPSRKAHLNFSFLFFHIFIFIIFYYFYIASNYKMNKTKICCFFSSLSIASNKQTNQCGQTIIGTKANATQQQ